jgi:DNA-binding transcriptional regulator LsrR (DeoR family)
MVIAVAAGAPKAASILGALRARAVDVLITDEATATWLLKANQRPDEATASTRA